MKTTAQWFAASVSAKRKEAEGIWSFELTSHQGGTLPRFDAGAHLGVISVSVPIVALGSSG